MNMVHLLVVFPDYRIAEAEGFCYEIAHRGRSGLPGRIGVENGVVGEAGDG
jgi:hypothetical protein